MAYIVRNTILCNLDRNVLIANASHKHIIIASSFAKKQEKIIIEFENKYT